MYFSVKSFEIFKKTFFTEHKFERLLMYITIIIYEYLYNGHLRYLLRNVAGKMFF